ncbi:hypothetical protein [Candidatus Nitrososphaera gargensis]|uniref:hypothetical protein n=1 Tax=Candidatus Nitrososphaera gargensis TaxID=497727 RepID=UPI00164F3C4C|nr:hypothetical protein [Candidatus Nitrososphaera gargensis]
MAANVDKVEEKIEKELEEKIKVGKSRAEIGRVGLHNVAYKIKDRTDEMMNERL